MALFGTVLNYGSVLDLHCGFMSSIERVYKCPPGVAICFYSFEDVGMPINAQGLLMTAHGSISSGVSLETI